MRGAYVDPQRGEGSQTRRRKKNIEDETALGAGDAWETNTAPEGSRHVQPGGQIKLRCG